MRRIHNTSVGSIETQDGTINVRSLLLADGTVDTVFIHQGGDTVALAPIPKVKKLVSLLQRATEEHPPAPPAPEPLRRFPALYERLQVHDASTGRTWPEHRYAIEVGAGSAPTEGRAYVRIDGDGGDSTAVFLWDEDRRHFDFRGNTNLCLIPVDGPEED